ncbi:FliG C-terminal domain-containing protein [Magnetovibrio sp. PR-2]|uniref:FliG C-terminal domain-containing protein n=1 Tax=Magnetovibrio sp. PR-2 TaxID=3120356 RepID=UPI002FCE2A1B
MRISVKKAQNGVYALTIGDHTLTLSTLELKHLLMEAVKALTPGAIASVSAYEEACDLAERLKSANAPGLQKLMLSAVDDDMVIFLKATEKDEALHKVFFDNMSDHKKVILSEDLQFRFPEGVDEEDLSDAVIRLIELTNQLQADGVLETSK